MKLDEEENEFSYLDTSAGRISVDMYIIALHNCIAPPPPKKKKLSKCFQKSYFILPQQACGCQSK